MLTMEWIKRQPSQQKAIAKIIGKEEMFDLSEYVFFAKAKDPLNEVTEAEFRGFSPIARAIIKEALRYEQEEQAAKHPCNCGRCYACVY